MSARIAVVGAGISGLAAAWRLQRELPSSHVTLFEAETRCGGHAHTVDLMLNGQQHGVDTGFLVYNERTYPGLIALFDELKVPTAPAEMSFSVQSAGLEWSGNSLNSVFAQRSNLLSPPFWGMLADLLRFNRLCTALAEKGGDAALAQPIAAFLDAHRFGQRFRLDYLLPMVACIWSCPVEQMLQFPLGTLIRFCHNHGLLQVRDRPQWYTVCGGSRVYVDKLRAELADVRTGHAVQRLRRLPPDTGHGGVMVDLLHAGAPHSERFDEVVLACHSDQALALLPDASQAERRLLGAVRYHANRAVLHTDASLLPRRARAWAAWNYERAAAAGQERGHVCLHYLLNRLQPLPWQQPVIVSLNPVREPHPTTVHGEFAYAHPVFDRAAVAAQQALPTIQGMGHVWFCGAWTRHGFHEDGLQSGLAVARALADKQRDGAAQAWPLSA